MLDIIYSISPFPTIDPLSKELKDGSKYPQSPECKSCRSKSCCETEIKSENKYPSFICEKGLLVIVTSTPSYKLLINGLLTEKYQKLPHALRSKRRAYKIDPKEVTSWLDLVLPQIDLALLGYRQDIINDTVNVLHDISSATKIVNRNLEDFFKVSDVDLNDLEAEGPRDWKQTKALDLLNSVRLLSDFLKLPAIAVNPGSASVEPKRKTNLYSLVYRVSATFKGEARRKHLDLYTSGSSHLKFDLFDTFVLLPFILIENAIKYSVPNNRIGVAVNEVSQSMAKVTIDSVGPKIDTGLPIFDKGFRSPEGVAFVRTGKGYGLYIADIVAKAHQVKIDVSSVQLPESPHYLNTFSFDLRGGRK